MNLPRQGSAPLSLCQVFLAVEASLLFQAMGECENMVQPLAAGSFLYVPAQF